MASKSLGVLTLDLVAKVSGFVQGMDAAERSSAKWRKEVEKNAKAAGVAIGAGIAAGVTALGAITVGAINSAKEISNLSSVANTSTTEFQKYAAGAKVVGIEQEKLADIFKDVNDKVGDFLNTGGGALADFFTNIAPKVGVTADDFRNLSGPQALGLYVHSLEKANVSQADMTFYMEAIASDATSLLPLLRNNSEGFTMLGDAAEAAGAIMDDATEVAKLQFEIESGKLKGINAQQQERLNGLAAELDRLQKLKKANEDAAKAAAFGSNLDQENSTAAAGLDIDLAGAGMGEKYRSRLQEMLQIKQTYNEKLADLNEQYNSGEITKELYDEENEIIQAAMEKRLKIQEGYYERADEAQADWMKGVDEAFQNYVDSAENHYQIAADAITGILGGATSALSDSIYDVFTGTETLSDSLGNLAVTIGQTIVKAIADMAAQWLVAQAIQLVFGRTTQMSAAATMAANAQATSLQAGLAAFASTAAIPIVGPALAPGAMAAALAITEPVAIAVGTSALAGMAHDGIDKVPVSGTWNLEKGERVTTAETSAKLDRTLERVQAGMANGGGRNSSITNNFYQTTTDARSQQAANAKAARQIARIVNNSERYT